MTSNFSWKIASQKHIAFSQKEILGQQTYHRYGSNEGSTMVAIKKLECKAYVSLCKEVQIETDASAHGWGAHIDLNKHRATGTWDYYSCRHSSNFSELTAVWMALKSFAPIIKKRICPNIIRQHNNSVIF